jgi:type VI secretion system protein ImpB
MAESTQHKLDRVRPPRVQITYDVETGDAIAKKELPFVVGVLADLAGKPAEALPPLKRRKFVEIDRDNFNDVMEAVGPRIAFQVQNRLTDEDVKLNVELNFSSMDDFDPLAVVQQVESLRKLYEARQRLSDLLAKLDGNDRLEQLLQEIVESTEQLKEIQGAVALPEA